MGCENLNVCHVYCAVGRVWVNVSYQGTRAVVQPIVVVHGHIAGHVHDLNEEGQVTTGGDRPLPRYAGSMSYLHAMPGAIPGGVSNQDGVDAGGIVSLYSDLHISGDWLRFHAGNGWRCPVIAV